MVLFVLLLLIPEEGAGSSARPWDLMTYGSLREIFHSGQVDSAVSLDSILPNPELYAVGALAGLAGEITVVAGTAYIGLPAGADSSRTRTWSEGPESACLLVTATVEKWIEVSLEKGVRGKGLDQALSEMAESAGLDVDEAFPFLIEGEVRELSWHVIDGDRLKRGETSHSDHLRAAVQHHRAQISATLIGFYSPRDHGVFTHMGSNTHIHCVLKDPVSSGHVDDVLLPAGTRVRLPVRTTD
jgi:acetolactate decarboxylase